MKIDYVIISSDDNPIYKDFYEVVAKRWFDLGFKTYYINITNENNISENQFGIIHKIKSIQNISTGFQSQVVRLYATKFINGNVLTSDIDMLPVNGDYYNQYVQELTDRNVIIYTGQPYGDVPYYPMCYILSHSSNFVKLLNIDSMSFGEYCDMLVSNYGEAWNTDEHFLYDKLQSHQDRLIIKSRNLSNRIDRYNWNYDLNDLRLGRYIDSHLLRPYSVYKNEIDDLIKNLY
jgi:hypothetical protein